MGNMALGSRLYMRELLKINYPFCLLLIETELNYVLYINTYNCKCL